MADEDGFVPVTPFDVSDDNPEANANLVRALTRELSETRQTLNTFIAELRAARQEMAVMRADYARAFAAISKVETRADEHEHRLATVEKDVDVIKRVLMPPAEPPKPKRTAKRRRATK